MKKGVLVLLCILILSPLPAGAHPHVYIDMYLELDIDEYGLKGFWENWTIVRNFGRNIGRTYDENGDGLFDPGETQRLERELFRNISTYRHYTFITLDDGTYFPGEVTDFSALKIGETTRFRFYVPCRIEAGDIERYLQIVIYDPSRYVSFGLTYISDPRNAAIRYTVDITRDDNVYSHSNDFGNAIIHLVMALTSGAGDESAGPEAEPANLVKLDESNGPPMETKKNPFLSAGTVIRDDAGNPFLGY